MDESLKKIQSIGRQTLNQKVYENLKMSILNKDLLPGTKLSEVQVAKQLNVSPTPVREAFRMLATEGLVKIEPWKGVVVQEFSETEVLEVFQCREVLELLALELTINKLKNNELPKSAVEMIDHIIEDSKRADDLSVFVRLNSSVHDFWINNSQNSKLIYLMSQIREVLLHDRNLSAYDDARRKEIVEEHVQILNAIRELNIDKAKEALRYHIKAGYEFSKKIRTN